MTEPTYDARTRYQDRAEVGQFETARYSTPLGRARLAGERRAVQRVLAGLGPAECILDCPCGIGRWAAILAENARRIIGLDISVPMLERARREQVGRFPLSLARAEAERLPLGDACVDYVFCYALMKHLPSKVKRTVLSEFARVSRRGVVASFAVFNPLTWLRWRWMTRRRHGRPDAPLHSYPVWSKELEALARAAGLRVGRRASVLGWLSLEKVVHLERPVS
jgi:ubiquinone/menaquinone biosynthesis C-methylase UbiE